MGDVVIRERPQETSIVRRRIVVVALGAIGTAVLAWGLRAQPASGRFYLSSSVVAVVWCAGGALAAPLHLGWHVRQAHLRRPVIAPIVVGAVLAAVFVVGALVVRHIEVLADRVEGLLAFARNGSWPAVLSLTVANGIAEEVFFRGAVQPALPKNIGVPGTVVIYAAVTMATGNIMLGVAAVLLGIVVGLQRQATNGVLAPILTHVTWSVSMLVALPLIFR
jgi:membrane protease YdiL (CAAX protease family)